MVNMTNMKTKRPSKKLDHKRLGPVKIVEAVGKRAFRVELPYEAKNHPVFHVAELELYRQSDIEGQKQPPPPVEEIEGVTALTRPGVMPAHPASLPSPACPL